MLGQLKEKDKAEQIKKARQKWLDDMMRKSVRLKRLVEKDEAGWREFVELLDDYVDKCKKRKVATALDIADDETIKQLKYLDHEVYILHFVKNIPQQFIKNIKDEFEKDKKKGEQPTDDGGDYGE